MLKTPNTRARKLLDLANDIELLDPGNFDMKSWQTCICGHYLKANGYVHIASRDWEKAAQLLDLTLEQASELFAPCAVGDSAERTIIMEHTPRQAADRIRRFAFALE